MSGVVITDSDPRWQDGARVRGELPGGEAMEGTLRLPDTGGWVIAINLPEVPMVKPSAILTTSVSRFTTIYLVEEAPNPRLMILKAMCWTHGYAPNEANLNWAERMVEGLRERGVTVEWAA